MASGLSGDDFLLNARLQRLRFRQGQTQVADIPQIVGPDDLHDIRALRLPLDIRFDQPQNQTHP
jgi:hypothetical protein